MGNSRRMQHFQIRRSNQTLSMGDQTDRKSHARILPPLRLDEGRCATRGNLALRGPTGVFFF